MVGPEIPTVDVTFPVDDEPFALSTIVGPLAIVDLLSVSVVHPSFAVSLAVGVRPIVNVAGHSVMHEAMCVLTLVQPATLIG